MSSLAVGDDDTQTNKSSGSGNNVPFFNMNFAATSTLVRSRSEELRQRRDYEVAKSLQQQFDDESQKKVEAQRKAIEQDDTIILDLLEPFRMHILDFLNDKFKNVLGNSFEITCIEQNGYSLPGQPLYKKFVTAWQNVPNESIECMFHGTDERNILNICQNGLDPNRRGKHGQAYGPGEYFSSDARVSVKYCRGNNLKMLVFACLMDKSGLTHHGRKVIVVNKTTHQLPIFVVHFKNISQGNNNNTSQGFRFGISSQGGFGTFGGGGGFGSNNNASQGFGSGGGGGGGFGSNNNASQGFVFGSSNQGFGNKPSLNPNKKRTTSSQGIGLGISNQGGFGTFGGGGGFGSSNNASQGFGSGGFGGNNQSFNFNSGGATKKIKINNHKSGLNRTVLNFTYTDDAISKDIIKEVHPPEYKPGDEDPIDLEPLGDGIHEKVVKLRCEHIFKEKTVIKWLKSNPRCPICNAHYGVGAQPSGSMSIELDPHRACSGSPGVGTFVIRYQFPNGIQGSRMQNPGQRYKGTFRICYYPNTKDGNTMVELLKLAFLNGVLFVVGQSVTTGRNNCVVWGGIHQKTSLSGGPQNHGWPDPGRLLILVEECKKNGVHLKK